jgi:phosphate transport system permease protein
MSAGAPHLTTAFDVEYEPRLARRRLTGWLFAVACAGMFLLAVAVLAVLLWQVMAEGLPRLKWTIITNPPSTLYPERAGFLTALAGTAWLALLTGLISVTVGISAAVYLEEYGPRGPIARFIQLNIANLAGVPSIVYGILGLAVFVRWARSGESVLSGALTLSLLVMPVIIIASREALAAVPKSLREAAFALGATRWQTTWHHVLPAAAPGIITGVILALSRAIGETAPLLMVGALGDVALAPGGHVFPPSLDTTLTWAWYAIFDRFTAMPIQIYDWTTIRPQQEFKVLAAAGILVLLAALLVLNGTAAGLRAWRQRHRIH